MNREEIFAFMNKFPACHMATLEGDQPRVRGMLMYNAGPDGILFQSGHKKEVVQQLKAQPKVELCFNDLENGVQIRVTGEAKIVEDQALKERIVANRPFLKPIVEKVGYAGLAVIRIANGVAQIWTMATNMEPKQFVKL